MRTIFSVIIAALTVFCSASIAAEARKYDTNDLLTLGDYLEYTLSHNAGLKASFERAAAASEAIIQAKTLDDPLLMYGYATEDTPQRSEFEVMQMFPWFGVIKDRTDVATAMAKLEGRQYETKKLEVLFEVKQAFYEYSFLAKSIEVTTENVQLIKHFEEVARTKYVVSEASQPDVIRAQVEVVTMENDLITWEKSRPAITAKLNSLMNRPAESKLPWPQVNPYRQIKIDFAQVNELIMQNNPELQGAAYEIEAAYSKEKLTKKEFYPQFGIGVAVDAGMGEDMHSRTMPKIQLTLPIWRKKYKAAERQAKAQVQQVKQQKVEIGNILSARAQQVLFELESSDRKIRLYRDTIMPKVKEMVGASESAYKAGTQDFLNLIDSQRTLIRYQLEYERVIADNGQSIAELEMLTGTDLLPKESRTTAERLNEKRKQE